MVNPIYGQNRSSIVIDEQTRTHSASFVAGYRRATGEDVRKMMRQHGIKIARAAQIFGTSQANVRERRHKGCEKGLQSWEWMEVLPERHRSLLKLEGMSDREIGCRVAVQLNGWSKPLAGIVFNLIEKPSGKRWIVVLDTAFYGRAERRIDQVECRIHEIRPIAEVDQASVPPAPPKRYKRFEVYTDNGQVPCIAAQSVGAEKVVFARLDGKECHRFEPKSGMTYLPNDPTCGLELAMAHFKLRENWNSIEDGSIVGLDEEAAA